ncbi:hypothetical protein A4G19_02080 [Pasteurellaceae bacterium Macca]|nr:hypothetical protein [Pasteurellaceae bacterium Macca]
MTKYFVYKGIGDYDGFLMIVTLVLSWIFIITFRYSHLIRRVHDFNYKITNSALFYTILLSDLVYLFIGIPELYSFSDSITPIYNGTSLIGVKTASSQPYLFFLCGFISSICLIRLAFIKGTDGENDFGAKPVPFWKKAKTDN